MKLNTFTWLFAILSTLIAGKLTAQDLTKSEFTAPGSLDTICLNYDFLKGDTLIYRVESFDSIIINYDKPLLRRRFERIEIVVDSVGSNNDNFYLSQRLIAYISTESSGDMKNIKRDKHPWIGQKSYYEIDAFGKRYSYGTDDSLSYILTPGGAFTPVLFSDLGVYCTTRNASWIVKSKDELPENGVPFPLFNFTALYNFKDDIDTLGEDCYRLEYSRTGASSYSYFSQGKRFRTTNSTNAHGVLEISKARKIPIHLVIKDEQKLTFHKPSGTTYPGVHFINTNFILEERRREKVIEDE